MFSSDRAWPVIGRLLLGLVDVAAGLRAMLLLGGLVSVAFGVVLFARPGIGAVTIALPFGLFNLIYGTWMLVQGIELRRVRNTSHSPLREKKAA